MSAFEYPLNKDARSMDTIRIKFSRLDKFLYFCDCYFSGTGHHGVEVSRGAAIDQVSRCVTSPRFHDRVIGPEPSLHQILFSIELADFLAFRYFGAISGRRKKSRDTRTTCP